MSSHDAVCPHCGARLSEGPPPASVLDSGSVVLGDAIAPDFLMRSGSGDQPIGASLGPRPAGSATVDPLLGAIASGSTTRDIISGTDEHPAMAFPKPGPARTGSGDAFAAIDLNGPTAPVSPPPPLATTEAADPDGDVEIEYVNGPNWPLLILGSYASAATLALIWWVVIPRFRGTSDLEGFAPAGTVAVGSRRADHSRKVEPAPPIAEGRTTTIGRPIVVGSLEFTPLDISRQSVTLRRAGIAGDETRDGGSGAMAMRVRLRNLSKDAVFAPLDEAFLRDLDDGSSASFVELGGSDRVYLYPLPVESEWSIVGEDFPDLKPGESKESRIVTAADFPSTASPTTWRIKVRTGLDSTETIGVEVPAAP